MPGGGGGSDDEDEEMTMPQVKKEEDGEGGSSVFPPATKQRKRVSILFVPRPGYTDPYLAMLQITFAVSDIKGFRNCGLAPGASRLL